MCGFSIWCVPKKNTLVMWSMEGILFKMLIWCTEYKEQCQGNLQIGTFVYAHSCGNSISSFLGCFEL